MATVLIVDDTAVDRRLAGGLLETAPNINVCYAENGKEALLKIADELPDLVVTDLQMPDLDGLELVNQIGEKYPEIPVVLMTAHGSENIAAQALASGAASFVPKTELSDNLVETVMYVLMVSESDARYKKLVSCATKSDFEFALENDPAIIDPLIEMITQVTLSHGLLEHSSRVQMGVALEGALHNAMVRGNLEISRQEFPVASADLIKERCSQKPFSERTVYFRALVTPEKAQFTVRDMGAGFDTTTIPPVGDPDAFRDGRGRGLVLIQAFMDDVNYNSTGNELVMVKYASK